ncbi:sensor histidine kinase [Flectobacillus roseus]|uniref:Histidine kinase n=1 Tax=Flectobacillus roseus TaxID=502259 RepID=A0ABT6YAZ3_9BACT|nr:histidine kinase [Flectobacillus roseus]MDI9860753.1 histidine kinase [Flectobacillus roseus]
MQSLYAHSFRFLWVIILTVYSFANTLVTETLSYYPIPLKEPELLFLFFLLILGIWEGNRLIYLFISRFHYPKLWYKLLLGMASSILLTAILAVGLGYIFANTWDVRPSDNFGLLIKLFLMFAFRINLFLNILNTIYLYVHEFEMMALETEKLRQISTQAQLQAIRNQINPHFLFNNLSVLSSLISTDTTSSIQFVKQFSNVYRYVLKHHDKELITIAEELDFTKSYLFLLQKRFYEGILVEIKVEEQYLNWQIVPMALQMLLENTIKHNIATSTNPLKISLYTEHPYLVLSNNLQPKLVNTTESTNKGLSNIIQRYQFLSPLKVEVIKTTHEFLVKIPIIKLSSEDLL